MCGRKSKIGFRGIATGLFLLLLVASPCFAASYWGALFPGNSEEGTPIVLETQEPSESQGESSQATPIEPPQTFDERTLKNLQRNLTKLQETQQNLEQKSIELENSTKEFVALSQNSLALGEITDAQYEEMLATANGLASANAEQADRIAELEKAAGTRAYLMLDGIIGFEDMVPAYGVGLTLGTRLGNNLMLELGADYTIGRFESGMTIKQFSIDNFEFRAGIGWMF